MPLYIKRKNNKKSASADVMQQIKDMGADPLLGLAYYATGNVVALGFMTEEEYNKETVVADGEDGEEVVVQSGGHLMALKYISPKMRFAATRELAQYMHSKRAPLSIDDNGKQQPPQVILYLPEQDD